MKTVKNKLKKQGGFTLVEMLTVVAIIAILIAISIPMVTGALDRARKATDAANARAAKAEMSIAILTETATVGEVWAYDAVKGALTKTDTDKIEKYGKESGNTANILYVCAKKDTTTGADVVCYKWATPQAVTSVTPPTSIPAATVTTGDWNVTVPTF